MEPMSTNDQNREAQLTDNQAPTTIEAEGNTYAAAGVNIEEGDRAVELIGAHAKRATRPEVMGGLGGFAGLFKLGEYNEPVLAAGSDGVGTKLAVAQAVSYTHLTLPTTPYV